MNVSVSCGYLAAHDCSHADIPPLFFPFFGLLHTHPYRISAFKETTVAAANTQTPLRRREPQRCYTYFQHNLMCVRAREGMGHQARSPVSGGTQIVAMTRPENRRRECQTKGDRTENCVLCALCVRISGVKRAPRI